MCNVADGEVAHSSGIEGSVIAVWNTESGIFVGAEVIAEVFRIEAIEAEAQLIHHGRREGVVVAEGRVMIARLRVHVIDLDERGARRGRGEIAALVGFAPEEAVAVAELIVALMSNWWLLSGSAVLAL